MSLRIVRRLRAGQDIAEQISHYLGTANREVADRFHSAVVTSAEQLLDMPSIGAPVELAEPALQGIRFWPVRGFGQHLIFYRPTANGIEIVRVLHGRRDIAALFADDE